MGATRKEPELRDKRVTCLMTQATYDRMVATLEWGDSASQLLNDLLQDYLDEIESVVPDELEA